MGSFHEIVFINIYDPREVFGCECKVYLMACDCPLRLNNEAKCWPLTKLGYSQYKDKAGVIENAGSCGCEVRSKQQLFASVGGIGIS